MAMIDAKRILLIFLLSLPLLTTCKFKAKSSKQAYIIGSDDIELVSTENQRNHLAPDSQDLHSLFMATPLILRKLENGSLKFCSGNMLSRSTQLNYNIPQGERLIVTNHHCFADEQENGSAILASCADVLVLFGFSYENKAESFSIPCNAESLKLDSSMDLASFTIDDQDNLAKGLDIAEISKEESINLEAMIIHYPNIERNLSPHPQMTHLLPLAAMTQKNCKVTGLFGARFAEEIFHFGISHECDLTHGSSGSALINTSNNQIIGINWGGVTYQDGGVEHQVNVATASNHLRDFLSNQGSADATTPGTKITPKEIQKYQPKKNKNQGPIACGVVTAIPQVETPKTSSTNPMPQSLWAWALAKIHVIDAENLQAENKVDEKQDHLAFLSRQMISLDFFSTLFPTTTAEIKKETWTKLNKLAQDPNLNKHEPYLSYQKSKRSLAMGTLELQDYIQGTLTTLYPDMSEADRGMIREQLSQFNSRPCQVPYQAANSESCFLWWGELALSDLEKREDFIYFEMMQSLKDRQYRKTLRQLYQRQQSFSQDRLLYDRVQSIFARNQRGSGQVAIDYL